MRFTKQVVSGFTSKRRSFRKLLRVEKLDARIVMASDLYIESSAIESLWHPRAEGELPFSSDSSLDPGDNFSQSGGNPGSFFGGGGIGDQPPGQVYGLHAVLPRVLDPYSGMRPVARFFAENLLPHQFIAKVSWSDGTDSAGFVRADEVGFAVWVAKYIPENDPSFKGTLELIVTDQDAPVTYTLQEVGKLDADYATTSLTFMAKNISVVQGFEIQTPVLEFRDSLSRPASSYTASITWPDNSSSDGVVTKINDVYSVVSNKWFAQQLGGEVDVVISVDGKQIRTYSSIIVTGAEATLVAATSSAPIVGNTFFQALATYTFNTPNPIIPPSGIAYVNWGDGRMSVGSINPEADGSFTIFGSHDYEFQGTYSASIELFFLHPQTNSRSIGRQQVSVAIAISQDQSKGAWGLVGTLSVIAGLIQDHGWGTNQYPGPGIVLDAAVTDHTAKMSSRTLVGIAGQEVSAGQLHVKALKNKPKPFRALRYPSHIVYVCQRSNLYGKCPAAKSLVPSDEIRKKFRVQFRCEFGWSLH